MRANIVDLRYKMNDILKALKRNEDVHVMYRGKETALLVSIAKANPTLKVTEHEFFGSKSENKQSVDEMMEELRGGRY